MPLVLAIDLEAHAVVADGHCRHIDVPGVAVNHDGDISFPAGEGMVIAVGDQLCDDDAQRRHDVEVEDECVAIAGQRDSAGLNLHETAAQ